MVLDRITGVVYAAIVGGFTMCGRIKSFLFKGGRFQQFRSFSNGSADVNNCKGIRVKGMGKKVKLGLAIEKFSKGQKFWTLLSYTILIKTTY